MYGSITGPSGQAPFFQDEFRSLSGAKSCPGPRSFEVADGPSRVYLMRWEGCASALVADRYGDVSELAIVKVGMSIDPARRCAGLNKSVPPASVVRWAVAAASGTFPRIVRAGDLEKLLKDHFKAGFKSLGGEFFLAGIEDASREFLKIARRNGRR